jgi:predicted enzyme related to lactoylglutathione lyase
MANSFVHIELQTNDPGKAKEFYASLFDWKLEDMNMGPQGTYTMIRPGEGPGGGLFKSPMPNAPSVWIPYVRVDDVVERTKKAKDSGARVLMDKQDIPGMGSFSIIADPTGALIGLWQEAKK